MMVRFLLNVRPSNVRILLRLLIRADTLLQIRFWLNDPFRVINRLAMTFLDRVDSEFILMLFNDKVRVEVSHVALAEEIAVAVSGLNFNLGWRV